MAEHKKQRFVAGMVSTLLCGTLVLSTGASNITKNLNVQYQELKTNADIIETTNEIENEHEYEAEYEGEVEYEGEGESESIDEVIPEPTTTVEDDIPDTTEENADSNAVSDDEADDIIPDDTYDEESTEATTDDTQDVFAEDIQDIENIEDTENISDIENIENIEITEDIGDIEDIDVVAEIESGKSLLVEFNECFSQISKTSSVIDNTIIYTANEILFFINKGNYEMAEKFIYEMETEIDMFFKASIKLLDGWLDVLKRAEDTEYNSLYREVISAKLILKAASLTAELFFKYTQNCVDELNDSMNETVSDYYAKLKTKSNELSVLLSEAQTEVYNSLLEMAKR